jgi:uncharacterized protein
VVGAGQGGDRVGGSRDCGSRLRERSHLCEHAGAQGSAARFRRDGEGADGGNATDGRCIAVAISARHAYIEPMSMRPPTRPCVICGKPQGERLSPFCSQRCADVDLRRWLAGVYAIPAEEEDPDDPPGGPARDAGDP